MMPHPICSVEDSYSDFLDHFILLLAARFHAPLHTWDGIHHALFGSEATAAWQLVSRNVQLLLSAQGCQTGEERQALKHVEPHFFTPSVCRERAMYWKWKIQKQKERKRANRVGRSECDASDLPMGGHGTHSDPLRAVGQHSSFDITKESLTETVTSLYNAVRQHLPSSLLDASESDDDDEEEEDENTSQTASSLPASLSPADDIGKNEHPGQRKHSNNNARHGEDGTTAHRGEGQFFHPPTFQVSSSPTAKKEEGNMEGMDGHHRCPDAGDSPSSAAASSFAEEAMTSFQLEENNIFRVPMRSDAQIQRDKVIAQAKNAMLAKMQDMQIRFFQEYRRWVDLPDGVMDDPPPITLLSSSSSSSPSPLSSSAVAHPSGGVATPSVSSTVPLYSASTSTSRTDRQDKREERAGGGVVSTAVPSSSAGTTANPAVIEMLHALKQRLPPSTTGKIAAATHLPVSEAPLDVSKGVADTSSTASPPFPLPHAVVLPSMAKKENSTFKKSHPETPKKTERMHPSKPHSVYVRDHRHAAEKDDTATLCTAGTTSSVAGTTLSSSSSAAAPNACQESGPPSREDAKRLRRLQPIEYSDEDNTN